MAPVAARIAVLPTPGMGHLIPLVVLAKRLNHLHRIASTFFIPSDGPLSTAHTAFLSTLPSAIDYVLLPPADLTDLPPDAKIETRISLTVARSLPALLHAIESPPYHRFSAFVVDQFGTEAAFQVSSNLNIPCYLFFAPSAMVLSLLFHLPVLDKIACSSEFRDLPGKIQIPGCIPIHGRDLMEPVQDRNNHAYKWVLQQVSKWTAIDGILVNSFPEIEPDCFKSLQREEPGKPTVYPIGPLIQLGTKKSGDQDRPFCLKWLDQQPQSSVLYISFGSGGALSLDQTTELAKGLEISGERFLWVMRCPNDGSASANYFSIQSSDDPLAFLPPGFLEATKDRGIVVPFWAPQAEILAHGSTGGFVTHCGWNSSLEGIANGVPMIAWPLYAEQRMNAVLLHEGVGVSLRVRSEAGGEGWVVGRGEVAAVVRRLMVTERAAIVKRAEEVKKAAGQVVGEGGASAKALADLAAKWKNDA